jgi:hypothetical protein
MRVIATMACHAARLHGSWFEAVVVRDAPERWSGDGRHRRSFHRTQ